MVTLKKSETISFENALRGGALAKRKRVVVNDCQTLPTAVSGAAVTVEALPPGCPTGAKMGRKITAATGDAYAEVRQSVAQSFRLSDQDVVGVLMYWPEGQPGYIGFVGSPDNYAGGAANRIYFDKQRGGDFLGGSWTILLYSPAEDGTTSSGTVWQKACNATVSSILTGCGLRFGNGSGSVPATVYIAEIFRAPAGVLSRPAVMLGFDSFSNSASSIMNAALPALLARRIPAYWAGDANLIRDFPAVRRTLSTWYDCGMDVVQQGMWHADEATYQTYNPGAPARYPAGQGYALNPSTLSKDFDDGLAILLEYGFPRGAKGFCYPFNDSSPANDAVLAGKGVPFARAFNIAGASLVPTEFAPLGIGVSHSCRNLGGQTLAHAKSLVDGAIRYGFTIDLFCHGLITGAGSPPADLLLWDQADWIALLDHIVAKRDAGLIDVTMPSAFIERYA